MDYLWNLSQTININMIKGIKERNAVSFEKNNINYSSHVFAFDKSKREEFPLNALLVEQFKVTNQLFEQYSNTNRNLDTIYNIILIASVLLIIISFKIKRL
jgi:hypothetical protein